MTLNVSIHGNWTGSDLKVTAKLWDGKITKTASLSASAAVTLITCGAGSFSGAYNCTATFIVKTTIDGSQKQWSMELMPATATYAYFDGWRSARNQLAPQPGTDISTRTSIQAPGSDPESASVTYDLNLITINSLGVDSPINIGDKTIAVKATTTHGQEKTWTCNAINVYKGGYLEAADKVKYTSGAKSVTVPHGTDSTTTLDITETYNAGWKDAAAVAPSSVSGSDLSIRVPTSTPGSSKDISLAAVYNAGWNAAIDAAKAVTDAYHAGTSTTWSDSGTEKCSLGHSVKWSTSHTYTPQGSSYSGLYTLPSKK